jgi:phosphoribosylformylglycinamidine cyclo-ligase
MARVFNLGIGMVLVVADGDAFRALDVLRTYGHQARVIGHVRRGERAVRLVS